MATPPNKNYTYTNSDKIEVATDGNAMPITGTSWPVSFQNMSANTQSVQNVTFYGATGDGSTNDASAIQTAINTASAAGGGTVYLPRGTYKVVSAQRTDASVSYTGSGVNYTWSDNSILASDVGSYVIGNNVKGKAPKIVSVNFAAKTFVTDKSPNGTISSASVVIVAPGLVLPENVTILGDGSSTGGGSGLTTATKIYDTGTGITIFAPGGTPSTGGFYYHRAQVRSLSVWCTSAGDSQGSAQVGIWNNSNSMFFIVENVDISGYKWGGIALDYNQNNVGIRNVAFRNCGNASATVPTGALSTQTGGLVMNPFNGFVSADIALYNCSFQASVGFGVCGVGQSTITLVACQWNGTTTSSAFLSGTSVFIQGGTANMVNCWSESAATWDVALNFGNLTITGGNMNSATSSGYGIQVGSNSALCLNGVEFTAHTTGSVTVVSDTSSVSWTGCYIAPGNDPIFINNNSKGTVTQEQAVSAGVVGGYYNGSVTKIPSLVSSNGVSPGSFGTAIANNFWLGTGVPANGNGSNGDYYLRTDGSSATTHMYFRSGGTWTGIA